MKNVPQKESFFVFQLMFFAITACMWITLSNINPYEKASEIPIPDFDNRGGPVDWETKGNLIPRFTNDSVTYAAPISVANITTPSKHRGELWLPIKPPASNFFSLQTTYTAKQILPVEGKIGGLSLGIILYDSLGDRVNRIPLHGFHEGSTVNHVDEVFFLDELVTSFSIQVRFTVQKGQVTVQPIKLFQIKKSTAYIFSSLFFVCVYVLLISVFLFRTTRMGSTRVTSKTVISYFTCGAFVFLAITISVYPSADTTTILVSFENFFKELFLDTQIKHRKIIQVFNSYSTETIAHALVFFTTGLVLPFLLKKLKFVNSALLVINTAALTEAAQLFVSDRNATITDFLVDLIFGFIGLSLGVLLAHFTRINKSGIPNSDI